MVNVEIVTRPGVPALLSEERCREVLEAAVTAAGAPAESTVSIDAERRCRARGTQCGTHGQGRADRCALVPAAAAIGVPAAPRTGCATAPAGRRLSALPPGAPPHLGDIIVSVERAIEQAVSGAGGQTGDVSWAPADELRLLITHGGLHLCGWDHAEPHEGTAMRALERRLLARGSVGQE